MNDIENYIQKVTEISVYLEKEYEQLATQIYEIKTVLTDKIDNLANMMEKEE